jgi:DNA-binding NarL/FixJ family response regulator
MKGDRVGLISAAGALRDRIDTALAEAGLEVEVYDPSSSEQARGERAIVATVSEFATSAAAGVKRLRSRNRELPIVVVIAAGRNGQDCRTAISAGADGAVMEPEIETALAPTLSAVAGDQISFPQDALRAPQQPSFTRREKQVVGMLVLGFSNQEIGSRLGLAESTIKSHLSSAFEKLGVTSRTQATALILDTANGVGLEALAIDADGEPASRSS